MSPLFSKKPKQHQSRLCSQSVPEDDRHEHYKTHLIEVTDDNGLTAYTFSCPRHGLADMAWGGGRPDPKGVALSGIYVHFMQVHGDHGLM